MIVLIIVLLTLFAGIGYLGHRSYGPGIDAVPLIMLILLLFWLFGGGFHSLRFAPTRDQLSSKQSKDFES
jgi:hypothetical protein